MQGADEKEGKGRGGEERVALFMRKQFTEIKPRRDMREESGSRKGSRRRSEGAYRSDEEALVGAGLEKSLKRSEDGAKEPREKSMRKDSIFKKYTQKGAKIILAPIVPGASIRGTPK